MNQYFVINKEGKVYALFFSEKEVLDYIDNHFDPDQQEAWGIRVDYDQEEKEDVF